LDIAVTQMLERPWGITAFGAASVKAVPDLVRVRFKIVRVDQVPAAAFEAARTAVRAVRGVLRQHGISDAAVEGSRLDLRTATEYVNGAHKFVGYRCQAAFAIESRALDDVEQEDRRDDARGQFLVVCGDVCANGGGRRTAFRWSTAHMRLHRSRRRDRDLTVGRPTRPGLATSW
jgi:hypothetical protein